jgi:hypothetical protein
MQALYERNAGDVNAGAFYALSLVALVYDGVDSTANRRKAIAILQPLFAAHSDNPGVDHYLIHASDDPRLARYGLAAARNYARIARDSAHALHMPSHIFTRLGYWQESIESNLASAAAAEKSTRSGRDDEWTYQLHALTFLEYAYLQSGQDAAAWRVVDELSSIPGTSAQELAEDQASLRTTYLIETHQWKQTAAVKLPSGDSLPGDQWLISWTRTIGEARSGNAVQAQQDFRKLQQEDAAMRAEAKRKGCQSSGDPVGLLEAQAWEEFAAGKRNEAVQSMRQAVAKEGPDGAGNAGRFAARITQAWGSFQELRSGAPRIAEPV